MRKYGVKRLLSDTRIGKDAWPIPGFEHYIILDEIGPDDFSILDKPAKSDQKQAEAVQEQTPETIDEITKETSNESEKSEAKADQITEKEKVESSEEPKSVEAS